MSAVRGMLARVLLSARTVRFSVANSWETPGSGIFDFLPYSGSLTGCRLSTMSKAQVLHRMELRAGTWRSSSSGGAGGDGGKGETKESIWGSKPKTMSKAEFRKRLEKLIAKPKATDGGIKRGSVWRDENGQFPESMTKEEFRKRLYLLIEGHLPPTDGSSEAEEEKQEARQSAETAASECPPSDAEEKKNEETDGEEKKQEGGASHGLWERLQAIYYR